MSVQESLSYERISAMLQDFGIPIDAAEAHGMLCGLLAGTSTSLAKRHWFAELLDASGVSAEELSRHADRLRMLDNWWSATVSALNDAQFGFYLSLPDDERPAKERSRALGDFCAGFGYGIGIALAGKEHRTLPEDTRELLADFQSIDSQCALDDSLDALETETALVELAEFVRVGVLLIHEELRPATAEGSGDSAKGVH